jgi:hypothetical protein
MNRCNAPSAPSRRPTVLALCLLTLGLWAGAAQAQTAGQRPFPPQALRGVMVVAQPPVITLDGQPAQLSPGARIRGTNNMLVMSGSLVKQELTVNYLREPHGLVHEVWILTAAEAEEKRPTAADLKN